VISPLWDTVILTAMGFITGSIPFGYLIARAKGVEIRKVGSGNIGATNSARALGTGWGIAVGLLDALKGFVPAYLAVLLSPYPGIVGAAAILGHIFSPWLGFRGGKGVSTALGVFLALSFPATLSVMVLWVVMLLATGYVSVASIASLAALPLFIFLWGRLNPEISLISAAAACALVVFWAHRGNILRLAWGKEAHAGLWKRMWKK
jgi:glycerol-3-phosphate acyltransferase PlsY